MDKIYDHKAVEDRIYALWEKSGFFNPDNLPVKQPTTYNLQPTAFCIIMPPPNANGSLHLGHTVFVTLQDIIIRYKRMRGFKTLWLPGADHAGFETQVVYDKKLEKEGINRFQIPRDELYKEIWDFTQTNKKIMESQLKKLGASCDWSREKFTLDPDIIKIVYDTFEQLYKDGLAYRYFRVINWCPKHKTSLSDLEVKYVERIDPLYYIKYKIKKLKTQNSKLKTTSQKSNLDDQNNDELHHLTIATVRPETIFGDTAIAVNPKDKRYKNVIGKTAILPFVNREILIIADEAVDPKFGTGVVKVTPAHSQTDFEIWQRHKNEIPGPKIILDEHGRLTGETGEFTGLKTAEARKKTVEVMERAGMLEKIEPNYAHQVSTCYKCGTILEPMPKPQWFIKMKPLAEQAIKVAEQGKITFIPDRAKKIYLHWLKNLRDWNISRQIPWGIHIPVWYCGGQKKTMQSKMGFHNEVIPELFKGKTKTYRLRDHYFKIGDKVLFENSQTKILFGYGIITDVEETTVNNIDYKDKTHYKTYKNLNELIAAFRLRNPDKKVTPKSKAYLYTYEFHRFMENDAREGCGQIVVSIKSPRHCPACDGVNFTQDPDVFDTWFSSSQWPFATLGYPDKKDYKTFYPTDVMETGYDILPFWVMRMIMMGLYRTKKVPFKTVYLHGLVRDKDKQKMSKSRGNVIDPLAVAELYGTDAVRMALIIGNTPGNDIVISEEKIKGYRNFANKFWNASRFVLQNGKSQIPNHKSQIPKLMKKDERILKDLDKFVKEITALMDSFKFYLAAEKLYHYVWHAFADKIIEESKSRLASEDSAERESAGFLLLRILSTLLKLMHPFMPFVTEAIWEQIPKKKEMFLMTEKWPDAA